MGKRAELVEKSVWDASAILLDERGVMVEQLYEAAVSEGVDVIINFY